MSSAATRMDLDDHSPHVSAATKATSAASAATSWDVNDTAEARESETEEAAAEASGATEGLPSESARIPAGFPRSLFTEGYAYGARILSDRVSVQYVSKAMHQLDVASVRSVEPIPRPALTPLYYFEVTIVDAGERNQVTVGIAPLQSACLFAPAGMHSQDTPVPSQASVRQHDTASLTCRQVGMDALSYGYKSEDGKKYHATANTQQQQHGRVAQVGQAYGPAYGLGDVVGCGVNYYDGSVFFTRNGVNLGVAFQLRPEEWSRAAGRGGELRHPAARPIDARMQFYPTVSLHSKGEHVRVNFGATPFKFDVDTFAAAEKLRIQRNISALPFERGLMLPLIRSYMLHQGYERSLEALADATTGGVVSAVAAAAAPPQTRHDVVAADTLQARNSIRELIESGDIDSAMREIELVAPVLWSTPALVTVACPLSVPALQLRLLSLRFISLLTSPSPTRLLDALTFAQQHLHSFHTSSDEQLRTQAEQVMGLLAYTDVHTSPLAHLLTDAYRRETADHVNALMLASLCAPPKATSHTHGVSSLELMLRHALASEAGLRQQGLPLALPDLLQKEDSDH